MKSVLSTTGDHVFVQHILSYIVSDDTTIVFKDILGTSRKFSGTEEQFLAYFTA